MSAPLQTKPKQHASVRTGACVLVCVLLLHLPAFAEDAQLAIAVGEPGETSYRIGQALASRLEASDQGQVELWESLNAEERIVVLLDEVPIAIVPHDKPLSEGARQAVGAELDAGGGYRVLIRADLDEQRIQEIIRVLEQVKATTVLLPASGSPAVKAAPAGQRFAVYFGFDDAKLEREQIAHVAAACRYAATLPSAEFVISGHADTAGPERYNDHLSSRRAQSVAAAIRSDERFRDALSVISFGERMLAVETDDEVREPKNRRVVIDVIPGKASEVP